MLKHFLIALAALAVAPSVRAEVRVAGAGSTFVAPAFERWIGEYSKSHGEAKYTYEGIGSGAGVKKLLAKQVDFAASDVSVDNPELVHVPVVVGAVSVVFNLPGVDELQLTPGTMSGIFQGQITSWDDPKLTAINPDVTLPKLPIAVIHRSDGSGTTAIFTDYLTKVSPSWKASGAQGENITWKVGAGAKGSDGIVQAVKAKSGSIGYVDLAHANLGGLHSAAVRNSSGKFAAPSILSASAAAGSASVSADLRGSITDAPGAEAYPIVGFSYVVVARTPAHADRQQSLNKLLVWVVNSGQEFTSPLDYAPLPGTVVSKTNAILRTLGADTP